MHYPPIPRAARNRAPRERGAERGAAGCLGFVAASLVGSWLWSRLFFWAGHYDHVSPSAPTRPHAPLTLALAHGEAGGRVGGGS